MFHDPCTDVSEARQPTRAQSEVLDLLGLTSTSTLVRLPLSDWRRVDKVADALARARSRPAAVIPRPRAEAGAQDSVTADGRNPVSQAA